MSMKRVPALARNKGDAGRFGWSKLTKSYLQNLLVYEQPEVLIVSKTPLKRLVFIVKQWRIENFRQRCS